MIVEYRQADDTTKIFGYMMSDGPLTAATGRMVRGWHHKCYWVAKKRAARGDAVTGRVVSGAPTAYDTGDMDAKVAAASIRLARMREVAQTLGKGVGDPQVQEAFEASERGGPYPHQHTHRLDTYQLMAHLEYAHGLADARLLGSGVSLHDSHQQLHANESLQSIRARRAEDPEDITERDWRTQYTAEVE